MRKQQEGAICTPRREAQERHHLLTPHSWTSSLQNREKTHVYSVSPHCMALCFVAPANEWRCQELTTIQGFLTKEEQSRPGYKMYVRRSYSSTVPACKHPSAVPTIISCVQRLTEEALCTRRFLVRGMGPLGSRLPHQISRTMVPGDHFSNRGHNTSGVHKTLRGVFHVFLCQFYTLKPK